MVRRFVSVIGLYIRAVVRRFVDEDIFLWCGAIAFKVLVAFLPVTVVAFGVFGLFLRREQIFATISQFVNTFTPGASGERVLATIAAFAETGATFTVVGAIALLVASISLFTTLRLVLENVFHRIHVRRHPLVGYLVDLRMAILCGLLFLCSTGLTLLFTYVWKSGTSVISSIDVGGLWLQRGWGSMWGLLFYLLPLFISTILFFLLFYLTPRPHPSVNSTLIGASITALLWETAKHVASIYAGRFGDIGRLRELGNPEGMGPLGEVFGLVVLLIFWVYYSSFVLVVGAMIASIRDEKMGNFDPDQARSRWAEKLRRLFRRKVRGVVTTETEGSAI